MGFFVQDKWRATDRLTMNFGIRSVPTLMIFKNGEMVDMTLGAVGKHVLVQKLNAALN